MTERKYLYAVEHPDGYFKIGKSADPYNRTSQIQTGSPYNLNLRFVLKYLESIVKKDPEPVVHGWFEDDCVSGEWFDISPSTVARSFHELMESDDIGGYVVYDIERLRKRESSPYLSDRLSRRPSL